MASEEKSGATPIRRDAAEVGRGLKRVELYAQVRRAMYGEELNRRKDSVLLSQVPVNSLAMKS